MQNPYQGTLEINHQKYRVALLSKVADLPQIERLPYSIRILLENLLRQYDDHFVTKKDINALLNWDPNAIPSYEIPFRPARVILQDFTGVPAIVDLAAMRDAMEQLGGNPELINPLSPVDLVIDHSVMVDYFKSEQAFDLNVELEFERNNERYEFLRWGQDSLKNFRVVPPGTGIVHQVNLEYLADVICTQKINGEEWLLPDTLVGTDSHTTMINGLGVLGWGVGGIEAEAAMLGQPVTMLIPEVIGVKLSGKLKAGATATDLVLCITEVLRKRGVVGKFVEFFGPGLSSLPLADRATIANMAPEYGATCGIFPIDEETLRFLRLTGRSEETILRVEHYAKAQHLFFGKGHGEPVYSEIIDVNLETIEPSLAGPRRPQDRINLSDAKSNFQAAFKKLSDDPKTNPRQNSVNFTLNDTTHALKGGDVVIAAITSCTNTSNPAVMLAAGLVAQKALKKGLTPKPWVKTSLAPGSQVVTEYLKNSGLMPSLEGLGFNLVGYGCTTCIGNSGPLPTPIHEAIVSGNLPVCAVLSGNRNFEGRIHPLVRFAYLASPPLVVAYALSGTMNINWEQEPLGTDSNGTPVFLKDIWPTPEEIQNTIAKFVTPTLFREKYAHVFEGPKSWSSLPTPQGKRYTWNEKSTYIQNPPYFTGMTQKPKPIQNISSARVLAILGDSVTTDHISPAGSIAAMSPAGQYLLANGVAQKDFNSYGARRGNHEVMMRGTFANVRLRNKMVPATEGGYTLHLPSNDEMSIYDAAMRYQSEKVPLVIFAGKEYGTGSSRDWAAKGTKLLGVDAVIAESFERIHRSNLIGMGVLPLIFENNQSTETLQLTGEEQINIDTSHLKPQSILTVQLINGRVKEFKVKVAIDTEKELEYFLNGGILHYVLRNLMNQKTT